MTDIACPGSLAHTGRTCPARLTRGHVTTTMSTTTTTTTLYTDQLIVRQRIHRTSIIVVNYVNALYKSFRSVW